jgi:hypothetical protein
VEKDNKLIPGRTLDCTGVLRLIARVRRELLRWLAALAAAGALIVAPSMQGQHAKPTEYEVKATYLYNFSRFVEWPARAARAQGDSFAICVLGQDPFGPALNAILADETVAGKSVIAKAIPAPQDAANCRVLFISSSEGSRLKQILAALGDASVLTVSDLPEFTRRGGMVQFVLEGNRVRFEVNLATAEHAGLTLSSELLKVATNVRRNGQPGD